MAAAPPVSISDNQEIGLPLHGQPMHPQVVTRPSGSNFD
jgi:hypothetical protein